MSKNDANVIIDDEKKKIEKRINPVQYYVKFSFSITYILLLTTATITFIEAMRTKTPYVRHILNLETCISVIAGYFYSVFLEKINTHDKNDTPIDWRDMTTTRYIDWSITTPLMLIALCLVLGRNINVDIKLAIIFPIIILNYIMLFAGYLGETNILDKIVAIIFGVVAFIGMFYMIFVNFVKPKYLFSNTILYYCYFIVWAIYGVVYMFNEEYKNIFMNILDLTAKSLIGLGLWAYYTKIIVV